MPTFRNYTAEVGQSGVPRGQPASGAAYGAGVGGAMWDLGTTGQKVSQELQDHQIRQDTLQEYKDNALLNEEIVRKQLEFREDGEPVTPRMMEWLDNRLTQKNENRETERGRQLAEQHNSVTMAEVLKASQAYDARLYGEQAKETVMQVDQANGIRLQRDPDVLPIVLVDNAELVESFDLSPTEKKAFLRELNAESAKHAVNGWISVHPDEAYDRLVTKGEFDQYLDPDVKKALVSEVEQEQRARVLEEARLNKVAEEQRKAMQTEQQNALLERFDSGELTTREILDSDLDPFGTGSKQQLMSMLRTSIEEPSIETDPGLFQALWDRVHLPDGDPNKLTNENELNAFFGRGLDVTDLNTLRGEIQGAKTQEGSIESELKNNVATIAKNQLTKSNAMTGIQDPIGDTQYQRFMTYFLTEYNRRRKAGESPIDLLDPDSPDYLGKAIRNFTRTPTEILRDMVNANTGTVVEDDDAPPPREPGESIDEYLNRVGNQ